MAPTPPDDKGTLAQILAVTTDLKQLYTSLKASSDYQLAKQDEILEKLEVHVKDIDELKQENSELKSKVSLLEEDCTRAEQYSRKDVMIVTGLSYTEDELQADLEKTVLGMFNEILVSKRYELSMLDICAMHRNGRKMKGDRPPSVTVKFLRFHEKDKFFERDSIKCRKELYKGINFFHCMAKGMINEQNSIKAHPAVKFVIFEGSGYFSVCLHGRVKDVFLNRIYSYKQFVDKYDNMKSGIGKESLKVIT